MLGYEARRRHQLRQLVEERDGELEAVRAEWMSAMLSTAPADRATAEQAIAELYRMNGLAVPRFVWTDSPASGALVVGMLSGGVILAPTPTLREALADPRWAVIGHHLRAAVHRSLREAYGDELGLDDPLRNRLTDLSGQRRSLRWDALDRAVSRSTGLPASALWEMRARTTYPWFLEPFEGQIPGEWMAWVGGPPVGESYLPVAGMPGWLHQAVYGDTGADAALIGAHDLWRRTGLVRYEPRSAALLDLLVTVARSCGWWWPYSRACVISERPVRVALEWVERQPRPHRADGPAIEYRDGLERYAWHGVLVPREVITGELTGEDWVREENIEIRRAIAERMGYAWLLDQCRATRIATDDYGTLWRLPNPGDEPVVLVDVVNSTPEPDGSYRRYVLRVPPDQTSPRDAIGWTFGLPPGAYGPGVMT